ncbi:MAG TPA: zinc dependent phospholipase C family protein [Methanobacteriaceae archaeon]|jgi:hypothetical protein|nr:zinc dependent phospholipase C family protein [Euryarchaeota archaeon]HNR25672.1 zinc dependent phospholipase C family protein [Methanobacteriaceae archaeon]HNS24656.1 zinc dependent phospholipase C family protein [Methanobacteriaceae archaeon]
MRKILICLIFVVIFSLVQAPASVAWTSVTHDDFVEEVYYFLPADAQQKLNLELMKSASDDPDFKFFDYRFHHYPASCARADYWLDRGASAYEKGDYDQASYSFGVASHYITDSFCAPHCVDGATGYHSLYEIQATTLNPHITIKSGNLDTLMADGHVKGQYSWNSWMTSRDSSYIQADLNRAASACYVAINNRI